MMVLYVAPLVGAWIETFVRLKHFKSLEVAPLVGAWIETLSDFKNFVT